MPWEKKFEEDKALDAAMKLFWQKGYDATSVADLVAVTGASRYGLYDVFGDKREFFLRVLDHYRDTVIRQYLGDLLLETASAGEIRAYFEHLIAIADRPEIRFGCLMCSTAIGLAVEDEVIRQKVHDYFDWLTSLFERALQNAVMRGELPASTEARELGLYLTGLVQGGAVFARSSVGSSAIATYFRTGLQAVFSG
jgi:TetR/AcrR family transcriptional regulator, transcriptional repressor for nem operon